MLLGAGCLSMWLVGILGYATSPELNTFSALIQNCYTSNSDGTSPHPAVHLTMSTAPIRTYISSAVCIHPDRLADSCLFVPIP